VAFSCLEGFVTRQLQRGNLEKQKINGASSPYAPPVLLHSQRENFVQAQDEQLILEMWCCLEVTGSLAPIV